MTMRSPLARRKPHRAAFALATLALCFTSATSAHAAQTLKLDLADERNGAKFLKGAAPAESAPLAAGTEYILTVSGTGSIWDAGAYTARGTCGIAEASAMERTPGAPPTPAAWDAAMVFAAPVGTNIGPVGVACQTVGLPLTVTPAFYAGFQFAVGAAYDRPVPIGGPRTAPRSDHTYQYRVIGEGRPARFRFADEPSGDNTGIFTITVRTAAECAAENCQQFAAPEFDQVAPPAVVAAGVSSKVEGARQCAGSKVLSVRLVQPRGVRFRKASYYLNGKKVRMVGRKTMYVGKSTKLVRVQKFRNLPAGDIKLRIDVTTLSGQRYKIQRTIGKCSTTKKARRIPAR